MAQKKFFKELLSGSRRPGAVKSVRAMPSKATLIVHPSKSRLKIRKSKILILSELHPLIQIVLLILFVIITCFIIVRYNPWLGNIIKLAFLFVAAFVALLFFILGIRMLKDVARKEDNRPSYNSLSLISEEEEE